MIVADACLYSMGMYEPFLCRHVADAGSLS
jgi:hypothetical protein